MIARAHGACQSRLESSGGESDDDPQAKVEEEANAVKSGVICRKCNNEFMSDSRFCRNCGAAREVPQDPQHASLIFALCAMFVYFAWALAFYRVDTKHATRAAIMSSAGIDATTAMAIQDKQALWAWLAPFFFNRLPKPAVDYDRKKRMQVHTAFLGPGGNWPTSPMGSGGFAQADATLVRDALGATLATTNVIIVPVSISQKRRSYMKRPAGAILSNRVKMGVTAGPAHPWESLDFSLLAVRVGKGAKLEAMLDSVQLEAKLSISPTQAAAMANVTDLRVTLGGVRLPSAFNYDITIEHNGTAVTLFPAFSDVCDWVTSNCTKQDAPYLAVASGYGEDVSEPQLVQICRIICEVYVQCVANAPPSTTKSNILHYCGPGGSNIVPCIKSRAGKISLMMATCFKKEFYASQSTYGCDLSPIQTKCIAPGPVLSGMYTFGDEVLMGPGLNSSTLTDNERLPMSTIKSTALDNMKAPWDAVEIKGVPGVTPSIYPILNGTIPGPDSGLNPTFTSQYIRVGGRQYANHRHGVKGAIRPSATQP